MEGFLRGCTGTDRGTRDVNAWDWITHLGLSDPTPQGIAHEFLHAVCLVNDNLWGTDRYSNETQEHQAAGVPGEMLPYKTAILIRVGNAVYLLQEH